VCEAARSISTLLGAPELAPTGATAAPELVAQRV
jgi:hypothetical protein